MRLTELLCAVAIAMAVLAPAQGFADPQSGQTGTASGTTGTGTTNTNNNANSTVNSGNRSRTNASLDNQLRRQASQSMISGNVVLDDGAPPPAGAVIIRDCAGRITREATVSPEGSFGFQLGGSNDLLPDASDAGLPPSVNSSGLSSFSTTPDEVMSGSLLLAGCELRAQLGGYRSSSITLSSSLTMGMMSIGTIVLYPTVRIGGTMVSVTNLAAPKDAKKALERAEKAFQKKNLDEAEKYAQTALKAYPGYASAWFQLGEVYSQSHRIEEARSAFSKAIEADRKYVNPLVAMARLAASESKWQEAAALTDRALDLDPLDFPGSYYINALANYNLKEFAAAERSARKLERLDAPHRWPQVHLIMAGIFNHKKDWSSEADELKAYLKHAPQSSDQNQVLARISNLENGKQ
jgi:tetratricopeptide (TPR) repeat protein